MPRNCKIIKLGQVGTQTERPNFVEVSQKRWFEDLSEIHNLGYLYLHEFTSVVFFFFFQLQFLKCNEKSFFFFNNKLHYINMDYIYMIGYIELATHTSTQVST